MSRNLIKVLGLFVAVVFGIAGCGGGGSGGTGTQTPVAPGGNIAPVTISGTASEGTLITGKTVKLKDANGTSAVDGTTNATTGIYTIDVTGLIAPFLLTVTGTNGTYVSLAQTAGTANINPITTAVVALAAGSSDVSALFTNITPAQLTAINTNYAAKSALVTASLQSALPAGVQAQDYFTGAITAGNSMDAIFDIYRIAIDKVAGITINTNDGSHTQVLSIPAANVVANTNQALPTIIPLATWKGAYNSAGVPNVAGTYSFTTDKIKCINPDGSESTLVPVTQTLSISQVDNILVGSNSYIERTGYFKINMGWYSYSAIVTGEVITDARYTGYFTATGWSGDYNYTQTNYNWSGPVVCSSTFSGNRIQ